jgi:hypothetical protein
MGSGVRVPASALRKSLEAGPFSWPCVVPAGDGGRFWKRSGSALRFGAWRRRGSSTIRTGIRRHSWPPTRATRTGSCRESAQPDAGPQPVEHPRRRIPDALGARRARSALGDDRDPRGRTGSPSLIGDQPVAGWSSRWVAERSSRCAVSRLTAAVPAVAFTSRRRASRPCASKRRKLLAGRLDLRLGQLVRIGVRAARARKEGLNPKGGYLTLDEVERRVKRIPAQRATLYLETIRARQANGEPLVQWREE